MTFFKFWFKARFYVINKLALIFGDFTLNEISHACTSPCFFINIFTSNAAVKPMRFRPGTPESYFCSLLRIFTKLMTVVRMSLVGVQLAKFQKMILCGRVFAYNTVFCRDTFCIYQVRIFTIAASRKNAHIDMASFAVRNLERKFVNMTDVSR